MTQTSASPSYFTAAAWIYIWLSSLVTIQVRVGPNNLYTWGPAGTWLKIPNSGSVISIGESFDGSIVGVGTNNLLNQAAAMKLGLAAPGYAPIDLVDEYRAKCVPANGFFYVGQNEQTPAEAFLRQYQAASFVDKRAAMQGWLQQNMETAYSTSALYKLAWEQAISGLAGQPYKASFDPISILDASVFNASSAFAASCTLTDSELTTKHLRVFAASSLYKGSGKYELLCANQRVVSVAIDKDYLQGKNFKIVSRSSGKVLAFPDGNAGSKLIQTDDTGAVNQQWSLLLSGNRGYHMISRSSGKAVDLPSSAQAAGTQIIQYDKHGGLNQQWRFVPVGDGFYKIVSACSNKVLDVTGSSTATGTVIDQWDDTGGANQQWSLVPVS